MRSCFADIPSEILYQILSHLTPSALICLCRASSCLAVVVQDYVQHSILCHHGPKSPYKLHLTLFEPALMTKHDDLELTYAGCLQQAEVLGKRAEKRAELRSDYSRFKVCRARGVDSRNSLDRAPTNGFSTIICLDELDSLYQFHTNMHYQKRGLRSGFVTVGRDESTTVRLWRNWLGREEERKEEDVGQSPREKDQIIWTGCAPDAIGFTVSVQRYTPSGEDEEAALHLSSVGGSREACEFYKVTIGEVLVRNSYLLALLENLVN